MRTTSRPLAMAALACALTLALSACGAPAATPGASPSPVASTAASPSPAATSIAGITVPLDVAGGQLLLTSVTYAPKGFGPLAAPDSWLEVVGKVVSGSPDLKALGSGAALSGDGTPCAYTANGNDTPFWVFQVKTTMRAFVFTLDGHPIPLDSLLPAR